MSCSVSELKPETGPSVMPVTIRAQIVRGETLTHILERSDRIGPRPIAEWMHKLAVAMQYAHNAGVDHRDLNGPCLAAYRHRNTRRLVPATSGGTVVSSCRGRTSARKIMRLLFSDRTWSWWEFPVRDDTVEAPGDEPASVGRED